MPRKYSIYTSKEDWERDEMIRKGEWRAAYTYGKEMALGPGNGITAAGGAHAFALDKLRI